jgi:hypothetical protein
MDAKLEDTIYLDFTTHDPVTGESTSADATPTCNIFENTTDVAILTPVVVVRAGHTGVYRVPVVCTTANGFEIGKSYNVDVTAIVNGVTAKSCLATLQMFPARKMGAVVADTGNTAATFLTDLTEADDDWWEKAFLLFVEDATLVGEVRKITSFDAGTNAVTCDAFSDIPAGDDKFVIVNY